MKTEQARSHGDNHFDCSSPPQKLQCDGLQPLIASAKIPEHLDKSQNTLKDLLLRQYKCPNSSEYKIYLCDYRYQGQTWSVDIRATSLEDAQKRLIALKGNGEIVGEMKLRVSVPAKETWLKKLRTWLTG